MEKVVDFFFICHRQCLNTGASRVEICRIIRTIFYLKNSISSTLAHFSKINICHINKLLIENSILKLILEDTIIDGVD
ncbi:hypothetical protein BpHYR1_011235 [Brachionus plicatilis]|uniref:Uncharacterized protein n=1 Tax=Brachionus plicatilis TaxID=10195 RepID=A0A3M7SNI5_BRAPC|nr:hypothetical protein BpHYR1_011235 [Brachionus plicatilis]